MIEPSHHAAASPGAPGPAASGAGEASTDLARLAGELDHIFTDSPDVKAVFDLLAADGRAARLERLRAELFGHADHLVLAADHLSDGARRLQDHDHALSAALEALYVHPQEARTRLVETMVGHPPDRRPSAAYDVLRNRPDTLGRLRGRTIAGLISSPARQAALAARDRTASLAYAYANERTRLVRFAEIAVASHRHLVDRATTFLGDPEAFVSRSPVTSVPTRIEVADGAFGAGRGDPEKAPYAPLHEVSAYLRREAGGVRTLALSAHAIAQSVPERHHLRQRAVERAIEVAARSTTGGDSSESMRPAAPVPASPNQVSAIDLARRGSTPKQTEHVASEQSLPVTGHRADGVAARPDATRTGISGHGAPQTRQASGTGARSTPMHSTAMQSAATRSSAAGAPSLAGLQQAVTNVKAIHGLFGNDAEAQVSLQKLAGGARQAAVSALLVLHPGVGAVATALDRGTRALGTQRILGLERGRDER